MVIFERDSTVDLLAGVPDRWIHPGSLFELKGVPTTYGRCSLRVEVSASGDAAEIRLEPLGEPWSAGGPTLYLGAFRGTGFRLAGGGELPERMRLAWGKPAALRLSR
jgi:hypothetical protein